MTLLRPCRACPSLTSRFSTPIDAGIETSDSANLQLTDYRENRVGATIGSCVNYVLPEAVSDPILGRLAGVRAVQDYPHRYPVTASAAADSNVTLSSPGLVALESAGPAEFGGPGDLWSPETLLVAAVADCFILSFRAIARGSKLEWQSLRCDADGLLDRVDKVTKFTSFNLRVVLEVPPDVNAAKAIRLLERAEQVCLITNSMTAATHLDAEVRVAESPVE